MSRRKPAQLHGVLVIDKPTATTSAEVVGLVRDRLGTEAAGHTGTLDPLATGVLPVCIGAATKLAQWLSTDDKAYDATVELGVETDTFDRDGQVVGGDPAAARTVDRAAVLAALAALTGAQDQVPPIYSAIQLGGRRMHELARAGETADLVARPERLDRLELTAFAPSPSTAARAPTSAAWSATSASASAAARRSPSCAAPPAAASPWPARCRSRSSIGPTPSSA